MNFEKHVIDTLKEIKTTVDTIRDQTTSQEERIVQNDKDIDDIKKNIIPDAIKSANNRLLKFLYAGGFMWAISVIGFLLKIFIFS